MNTNNSNVPKWVKVSKGETFTEDVLFATEEGLQSKNFCNIIHGKGCKAQEDGYYLPYNLLANLPKEVEKNPEKKYEYSIDGLIEALRILQKYWDGNFPTKCEHDMLFFNGVGEDKVSEKDKKRLKELGFVPYDNFAFVSYSFGNN